MLNPCYLNPFNVKGCELTVRVVNVNNHDYKKVQQSEHTSFTVFVTLPFTLNYNFDKCMNRSFMIDIGHSDIYVRHTGMKCKIIYMMQTLSEARLLKVINTII